MISYVTVVQVNYFCIEQTALFLFENDWMGAFRWQFISFGDFAKCGLLRVNIIGNSFYPEGFAVM